MPCSCKGQPHTETTPHPLEGNLICLIYSTTCNYKTVLHTSQLKLAGNYAPDKATKITEKKIEKPGRRKIRCKRTDLLQSKQNDIQIKFIELPQRLLANKSFDWITFILPVPQTSITLNNNFDITYSLLIVNFLLSLN